MVSGAVEWAGSQACLLGGQGAVSPHIRSRDLRVDSLPLSTCSVGLRSCQALQSRGWGLSIPSFGSWGVFDGGILCGLAKPSVMSSLRRRSHNRLPGWGREREGTSREQQGGEVERPLAEESGDGGISCSRCPPLSCVALDELVHPSRAVKITESRYWRVYCLSATDLSILQILTHLILKIALRRASSSLYLHEKRGVVKIKQGKAVKQCLQCVRGRGGVCARVCVCVCVCTHAGGQGEDVIAELTSARAHHGGGAS